MNTSTITPQNSETWSFEGLLEDIDIDTTWFYYVHSMAASLECEKLRRSYGLNTSNMASHQEYLAYNKAASSYDVCARSLGNILGRNRFEIQDDFEACREGLK